jgi:AcrR family transcriptional regulator
MEPRAVATLTEGNAAGRATRELIVRTAERLIAEKGLGVPMREISKAAGQRNNTSVQYHFGERDSLLTAVQVFRSEGLNRRRLELLGSLEVEDRLDSPYSILRAAIQPHVESLANPNNHFVSFLARLLSERGTLLTGMIPELAETLDAHYRLRHHLARQLPHLSAEQFDDRYTLVFAWAIHAIDMFAHRLPSERPAADDMLDDLVKMLVAALQADAPP